MIDDGGFETVCLSSDFGSVNAQPGPATTRPAERRGYQKVDLHVAPGPRSRADSELEPRQLRGYPKETVVDEKLQAMVFLGIANSRMKDFFDVWFLAMNFEFNGPTLARALRATFDRRKTELPKTAPHALTRTFSEDDAKMKQSKAFVFVSKTAILPKAVMLDDVIAVIGSFVIPPLDAAGEDRAFEAIWKPGGS